tara:strand:+ start:964 stop:1113 length:150 start_codon:yes stop_codon:yes gene_type:complete
MVSILEIFDNEFLYSSKFSLAARLKIIPFKTIITTTGISVIIEIKFDIK